MTDNSESLEIIDTVRRKMARAITEHGRSLRAMHEMHMGPFDQALFVDTAIGELDRLTDERDAARAELAELRNVIGILTFNMRDVSNMLIGMCQQYAYLKIAPDIESEASE